MREKVRAPKLTHYIEYLHQLSLVYLEKHEYVPQGFPIRRRDVSLVLLPKNWNKPSKTYDQYIGFRFFDRYRAIAPNGEVLLGEPRKFSEIYYVGTPKSLDDILNDENVGEERLQVFKIWAKSTNRFVLLGGGDYMGVPEKDIIITPDSVHIRKRNRRYLYMPS